MRNEFRRSTLTEAELKVLSLIARGHSSQEVADRLVISKRTVDYHLANIYKKYEVTNRAQAIRAAVARGELPLEAIGVKK